MNLTWKQIKGVVPYLEMKTRIKMQPRDWHTGYLLYLKDDGTAGYLFLPRVNCRTK